MNSWEKANRAFDVNEDPRKVNALSNLRPLWMHENLSKNSKWSE